MLNFVLITIGSSQTRAKVARFLAACLLTAFLCTPLYAQSTDSSNVRSTLAIIAGEPVYEDELPVAVRTQILQIRYQEFELKRRALDELVRQRLVEAEARRKGTTVEEVLQLDADVKVAEPSVGYGRSSEQPTVIDAASQEASKPQDSLAARAAYLERLQQQAKIVILLRPPKVAVGYDSGQIERKSIRSRDHRRILGF
jgi:hypothetical protein